VPSRVARYSKLVWPQINGHTQFVPIGDYEQAPLLVEWRGFRNGYLLKACYDESCDVCYVAGFERVKELQRVIEESRVSPKRAAKK